MKKHEAKKIRKTRSRAWILAVTVASAAVVAVIVGTVVSSKAQQGDNLQLLQAQDDDVTVEFANERIKIDAKTGRLRKPTVEEARALVETITAMTDRSGKGLKVERRADGRKQVDMKDRFQTVVLAKPNADGTNEVRCVTSMDEAAEFLGIDPSKLPAKNKSPKTN